MPASISPGEKPARSSATWSASARRAAAESSPLAGGGVVAAANADKEEGPRENREYQSWPGAWLLKGLPCTGNLQEAFLTT